MPVWSPEFGAAEADPGQELELEVGLAVQLALDVVLEDQLGQLGELAALGLDVPAKNEIHTSKNWINSSCSFRLLRARSTRNSPV